MALGAERLQVMRMVLKQAAIVAGIGISAGLLLSLAARPALLTSLGRPRAGGPLSGFDPLLFGRVPLALLLITLFAAAIPARHASRIDPQRTLRPGLAVRFVVEMPTLIPPDHLQYCLP